MTVARLVASGCGTGFAPVAPGTVASLAALVIGAALLAVSAACLVIACGFAVLGGLWAIRRERATNDPNWVVVDEFAGQWITMLGLGSVTPTGLAAAFLLFRSLDVAKPGPIGWADRQHGSFGVMADDVIAGLFGALMLYATQAWW